MAVYRYLAHDLRTNTFLGELPLGAVSYSEGLYGAQELAAWSAPRRSPRSRTR